MGKSSRHEWRATKAKFYEINGTDPTFDSIEMAEEAWKKAWDEVHPDKLYEPNGDRK